MKPVSASLVAKSIGWGVTLAGYLLWLRFTWGSFSDVTFLVCWAAAFSLLAWAIGVRPILRRFGDATLINSLRWGWLGWSLLGVASYGVLIFPLLRADAFYFLWFPVVKGVITGEVFTLLRRIGHAPEQ